MPPANPSPRPEGSFALNPFPPSRPGCLQADLEHYARADLYEQVVAADADPLVAARRLRKVVCTPVVDHVLTVAVLGRHALAAAPVVVMVLVVIDDRAGTHGAARRLFAAVGMAVAAHRTMLDRGMVARAAMLHLPMGRIGTARTVILSQSQRRGQTGSGQ